MTISNLAPNIHYFWVGGGAAGNFTVTGIATDDRLISVGGYSVVEAAPPTLTALNLTSEYTISAANTINNTGGTASTAGMLLVVYERAHVQGGDINRS